MKILHGKHQVTTVNNLLVAAVDLTGDNDEEYDVNDDHDGNKKPRVQSEPLYGSLCSSAVHDVIQLLQPFSTSPINCQVNIFCSIGYTGLIVPISSF